MIQCKSIGCDNSVTNPESDFCNHCMYIHSILGLENTVDEEVDDPVVIPIPLDTYEVHQLFNIQDPSGCLQRASRIILLSGHMNDLSDSPKGQDIMEARTMLTRWLQLNEYE